MVVVCAGGASSMIVLMIMVEYATRVVTLCACVIILCWSGCDYFQCDREIRFMSDAGQCGIIIDGGRWMYDGSRVYCILVFRMCVCVGMCV